MRDVGMFGCFVSIDFGKFGYKRYPSDKQDFGMFGYFVS